MPKDTTRPAVATLLGAVLLVAALLAAVAGLAVSWVSNCCGSAEPSDPAPALLGFVVAALLAIAAYGVVRGTMPARRLVALTAAVPAACLVAAPSSSDLATLAPFALVGWAGFAWLVTRPRMTGWLRSDP
jgi:hypothetical protein